METDVITQPRQKSNWARPVTQSQIEKWVGGGWVEPLTLDKLPQPNCARLAHYSPLAIGIDEHGQ